VAGGGYEKLAAGDLELVAEVLAAHPQVESQVVVLRAVVRKVKFPIKSLDDVVAAIGDGVQYKGFTLSGEDVKSLVSDAVFPIKSQKQLVAHAAALWADLHRSEFQEVPLEALLAPRVYAATYGCGA
jgi:hypothetical protein